MFATPPYTLPKATLPVEADGHGLEVLGGVEDGHLGVARVALDVLLNALLLLGPARDVGLLAAVLVLLLRKRKRMGEWEGLNGRD